MALKLRITAAPATLPLACDPVFAAVPAAERKRYAVEGDVAILGDLTGATLWALRPLDNAEFLDASARCPASVDAAALRAVQDGAEALGPRHGAVVRWTMGIALEEACMALTAVDGEATTPAETRALLDRLGSEDYARVLLELQQHLRRISGHSSPLGGGDTDPKASSGS